MEGCVECHFCRKDSDVIVLVPLPDKEGQACSCVPCAIGQEVYCTHHGTPHVGLSGGGGLGTICLKCSDEEERRCASSAERFYRSLLGKLPLRERQRLEAWVTDMRDPWKLSAPRIVLRGIVQEGLRRHVTFERVVEEVIATQSADAILPRAY